MGAAAVPPSDDFRQEPVSLTDSLGGYDQRSEKLVSSSDGAVPRLDHLCKDLGAGRTRYRGVAAIAVRGWD